MYDARAQFGGGAPLPPRMYKFLRCALLGKKSTSYLATEASDGPRDPSEDLRLEKLVPQMPGIPRDHDYASSYEEKSFFS